MSLSSSSLFIFQFSSLSALRAVDTLSLTKTWKHWSTSHCRCSKQLKHRRRYAMLLCWLNTQCAMCALFPILWSNLATISMNFLFHIYIHIIRPPIIQFDFLPLFFLFVPSVAPSGFIKCEVVSDGMKVKLVSSMSPVVLKWFNSIFVNWWPKSIRLPFPYIFSENKLSAGRSYSVFSITS